MPILNEKDAILVRDSFDLLSDEEKPLASDWMRRYEAQQNDLGEPLFPSQVQAMEQSSQALRKMFDGLDKVQAEISPWSDNPNRDRAIHANMALLSARLGKKPQEIADRYEFHLNDYAARQFGMTQGVDDLSFYAAAAKEIQREKQKEETSIEGVKAALRGDDVIPALQAWQAKNLDRMPDSTEFTRGFLQARERAGDQLEFAASLLKQIESNVGLTKGDGSQRPTPASREMAAQFETSLATLATMKPKDRKQVYAIIGAKAEAAGYDLKGFWSQMLSELGKGMARMGDTTSSFAADLFFAGAVAEEAANGAVAVTSDTLERFESGLEARGKRGVMYAEIADIVAGDVDPVRPVISWLNDTVETGLIKGPGAVAPFMLASAATGLLGAGALFTADFAEQNRRDLVRSGMDDGQARLIGMTAAPLQAAVESLSNSLQLGRFPAVQRALASFTKPIGGGAGAVARYVQNSTLALATEFTEEQVQDNLIVPATQEIFGALSEDVPDVDWSMYRNRAIESTPELLSILVPMALVFGGTMTAAQANLSGALVSSQDMLEAAGYSAAQANEIRIQSTPEAQVSKAREFWGARAGTPQTIEAAAQTVGERMRLLRNDTAAAQADLERRGILPRMLHAAEDRWKLTFNDGSTADFNSHSEADAARWQWATDQLGKVHLATRSALAQLESGAAVGREFAVEFKPDAMTAQIAVDEGRVDASQIERRVQQGEAVGETAAEPVNEADAFDAATLTDKATSDYLSSLQILGSSVNQFKDGVLRTTIRLYEGANVLTLVEEKLEGDAKQIVESRPGREWLLKSLREYERVSGDKLFRDVADDSQLQNDDLIEAWSSLGQSYLVGKSKKGAAIGKGGARRIFADVLKAGMAGAMNSETQFFNAVWRRAAKLSKLNREGKLGADLTEELERQLGIDSQTRIESEIAAEAEAIANEALYAGGTSYSEENPGPNGETFSLRSVTPAQDAEYLAAVEAGDMEKAQRMVDAAAKGKGPFYHRSGAKEIKEFYPWTNFGTEEQADAVDLTGRNDGTSRTYKVFLDILNPLRVEDQGMGASNVMSQAMDQGVISSKEYAAFPFNEGDDIERAFVIKLLQSKGYDGLVYSNEWEGEGDSFITFTPNQIKSADPVTRDADGNVIPLSQRFNPADDRITFSLRRKFDFSSKLAPAAEMLRNMRQSGKAFDFATAYRAASAGQSSSMLPLSSLYDEAKKQVPALTEADFGKQIQSLYESGNLLLEPAERADSMRDTLARFGVRDSLGIPAMFARPMETQQETFSLRSGNEAATSGMASDPGAAQAAAAQIAPPSPAPSALAQQWWASTSRAEARAILEPASLEELKAIAVRMDENPNQSKAKLIDRLVQITGVYADAVGIRGADVIGPRGPMPDYTGQTAAAQQRMREQKAARAQQPKERGLPKAKPRTPEEFARDMAALMTTPGRQTVGTMQNSTDLPAATATSVNPESSRAEDGTFSIRSGDFASRMAAAFSPFQRNPELRMAIAQVAKQRAQRLGAEWIEKSAVLRTVASIAKEQGIREALGYDERINSYLESLTPSARQELEFEPAALDDDPLVSAMLDYGKLMSQSTAKKAGKVEAKSGDYDGAPWLPPAWYSKGAGIMPDQMAQAMFDAGLLPDAFTGTLWAALESRIASTKKNKTAHREAVQAYNAAKRTARAEAKAEAEAWAKQTRKAAGSPKAQRDMLKAALRTLDGILSAAPPEVRARVGGYVKLAGLATDEAMLQEIERRIEKLNVELEKWLKKEGVAEIQKLLKRGRPEAEAGKRGKGKDADMHALFAAAERAIPMTAEAVAGELARLDTLIGGDTLTPEQEALAITERGIIELVGDLKSADSGRVFSGLDTLREIYEGGWIKWKLAQIEKREERAGMRADFIADTGKSGIKPERDAADKAAVTLLGKIKGGFLSLSSFQEVLSYAFGSKSNRVKALVDAEREASGQYEDVTQALADEVESLFADLAGGSVLAGERLRFDMAQRTIKTGKGELSQLEAIQALLMWRQEDGRRHMEGAMDENGKPIGPWNYDQAWIDEITAALTPEARSVMSWLSQKYAAEHPALNALYRQRYGVNMPAHDNYAPITVQPVQTKSGEVNDPVSGAAISSGSILVPGSLRARSRSAIAEPDFRDSLQTFMAHTRQLEYWKAYYDLAFEANAILGNREVLNAVKAKGGEPAATALRKWIDAIAQGGFRDASASLGLHKMLSRMTGRAASVGLLGRFSTLLVQSTQLGAASVKMPVGAYLIRLSKLLTGNLSFRDAINSPFIQRRYKSAPPIVRQALEGLGVASRPNQITRATRHLGNLLSGADAMFTAGTYAMLLDYHRGTGRALGLSGAELETHAHTEAERDTEAVAQPTRMATRSLAELTSTNPLAKVSWAYASEARQKIALMAWATMNATAEPAQFAKTAFLVFGIGGLMTQVLKGLWREAKGDDDESKWSPERLTLAALAGPLHGVPLASELMGDQGMLSGVAWAWPALKDIASGEGDMRDVDTLLSTMGLFNDTAAGIASLSHAGLDAAKVLENLASEK